MQQLKGIAVSPGVAIGEALVMDNEGFRIPRRFVTRDTVEEELQRLDAAIEAAGLELIRRREAVSRELGEKYAAIFEAHLQMLQDSRLRSELEEMIRQRHYSPEYAVSRTLRRYAQVFQRLESDYLAERANANRSRTGGGEEAEPLRCRLAGRNIERDHGGVAVPAHRQLGTDMWRRRRPAQHDVTAAGTVVPDQRWIDAGVECHRTF